ncbi:MAG: hypothetical protein ABI604_19900 [Nitrospirota bacterium]
MADTFFELAQNINSRVRECLDQGVTLCLTRGVVRRKGRDLALDTQPRKDSHLGRAQ